MENLTISYSPWWLLVCASAGLLYAGILYFRERSFNEIRGKINWWLGILRFLTVTTIAILLLSPLLKSLVKEIKKPVVVIAQDQSESIGSVFNEESLADYSSRINNLKQQLGDDYEVVEFGFGEEVTEEIDYHFDDKVSNISKVINAAYDQFSNQNLGAVILATDGIYNEGSNPLYANSRLSAPIYTIALGDTTPKVDILLKRVLHNQIAYLGDKFTVQTDISALHAGSETSVLTVYKRENNNWKKIQSKKITVLNDDFFATEEIILDADVPGVHRFRFSLSEIKGEENKLNNSLEIFVDVLDGRQKILILANAPHPDITALKQSFISNKNYEVEIEYADDFSGNVRDYGFVVLHNLPSDRHKVSRVFNQLQSEKKSHLIILGSQTNIPSFNQVQNVVSITSNKQNTNDVQAGIAKNFSLFNLSEDAIAELPKFAPLISPFGEYAKGASNPEVLLYQRIGKVDTEYPLLLFSDANGYKRGVLCGEGLWKWRLFDYLQHKDHFVTEEIIGKSIQYLSLKEDKRRFRVPVSKNIFDENENILFDAELYNESYQLINADDVSMIITDESQKQYPFTFNKTPDAYTLNAGYFPVGNYRYRAKVFSGGKEQTFNGQFSVQPIQLELYETTANHNVLQLLSDKYGGNFFYANDFSGLVDAIKTKETVKPVLYQTSKTRSVINLKWICLLLAGLLTFEWFFRRYFGAY